MSKIGCRWQGDGFVNLTKVFEGVFLNLGNTIFMAVDSFDSDDLPTLVPDEGGSDVDLDNDDAVLEAVEDLGVVLVACRLCLAQFGARGEEVFVYPTLSGEDLSGTCIDHLDNEDFEVVREEGLATNLQVISDIESRMTDRGAQLARESGRLQ